MPLSTTCRPISSIQGFTLTAGQQSLYLKIPVGAEISVSIPSLGVASGGTVTMDYTQSSDSAVISSPSTAVWNLAAQVFTSSMGFGTNTPPIKAFQECWIRFNCVSGSASVRVNPSGELFSSRGAPFQSNPTGTHAMAAVLGDSIGSRSFDATNTPPIQNVSANAIWNFANAVLGAPFMLAQNLAVSGDKTLGIFSRISSVAQNIKLVFLLAGINDVLGNLTALTITTNIGNGVKALVTAEKIVVISKILPQNALTGAQVAVLLAVNAFIDTLSATYPGLVFVIDGFAALGGNTTTGASTPTNYLNSDFTHPTAAGAQAFAQHPTTRAALTAAFNATSPNYDMYFGWQQVFPLYNEFRRNTGGTAGVISAGSGTIADNWQCYQNAGTATFTVDATQPYTVSTDFIGAATKVPVSQDAYWQIFNITSASASDNPRLRTVPQLSGGTAQDGAYAGCQFFVEFEVQVTASVGLQQVSAAIEGFLTPGTSPADQPAYGGGGFIRASAGTATDSGTIFAASPAPYHAVWRTPIMRFPENINNTVAPVVIPNFDMVFGATGSATVKLARPRIFMRNLGERLSM